MQAYFPGIRSMDAVGYSIPIELPQCNTDLASGIISPQTVKWAMNTFTPFKSPGMDEIYPILLQKSGDLLIKFQVFV